MEELLYDVSTLARIIIESDLSAKEISGFLSRIWNYEGLYLPINYRFNKRKFFTEVLDEVCYWQNKKDFDKELSGVNNDLQAIGSEITYITEDDYYNLKSYFMELRLRMIFLDNKDYIRMKLRTLLQDHGYKRRTAGLNSYFKQCMYFYHIETFARGGVLCDVEKIALDDMIVFRVLDNPREYIEAFELYKESGLKSYSK